jgi:hypothetical protein
MRPKLSPGAGLLLRWRPSGCTGLIAAGAVVTKRRQRFMLNRAVGSGFPEAAASAGCAGVIGWR